MIERNRVADETDGLPSAPTTPAGGVRALAVLLAVVGVGSALWATLEGSGGRWLVAGLVVVAWAISGVVVSTRLGERPLGPMMTLVAAVGGVVLAAASVFDSDGGDVAAGVRLAGTCGLVAVLFHLALSVPDGRLGEPWRRVVVGVGYLAAAGVAAFEWSDRADPSVLVLAVLGAIFAVVALVGFVSACRVAGRVERAVLQWMGWGIVTAAAIGLSAWGLHALLGWPTETALVALAASVIVPLAFVAATSVGMLARVDRLLVHTFVVIGLVALVGVVYFFVVIGLGRAPEDQERSVLGALDVRCRPCRGPRLPCQAPSRGARQPAGVRRAERAR